MSQSRRLNFKSLAAAAAATAMFGVAAVPAAHAAPKVKDTSTDTTLTTDTSTDTSLTTDTTTKDTRTTGGGRKVG